MKKTINYKYIFLIGILSTFSFNAFSADTIEAMMRNLTTTFYQESLESVFTLIQAISFFSDPFKSPLIAMLAVIFTTLEAKDIWKAYYTRGEYISKIISFFFYTLLFFSLYGAYNYRGVIGKIAPDVIKRVEKGAEGSHLKASIELDMFRYVKSWAVDLANSLSKSQTDGLDGFTRRMKYEQNINLLCGGETTEEGKSKCSKEWHDKISDKQTLNPSEADMIEQDNAIKKLNDCTLGDLECSMERFQEKIGLNNLSSVVFTIMRFLVAALNILALVITSIISISWVLEAAITMIICKLLWAAFFYEPFRGRMWGAIKTFVSYAIVPFSLQLVLVLTDAMLLHIAAWISKNLAAGASVGGVAVAILMVPPLNVGFMAIIGGFILALLVFKITMILQVVKISKALLSANAESIGGIAGEFMKTAGQMGSIGTAIATGGATAFTAMSGAGKMGLNTLGAVGRGAMNVLNKAPAQKITPNMPLSPGGTGGSGSSNSKIDDLTSDVRSSGIGSSPMSSSQGSSTQNNFSKSQFDDLPDAPKGSIIKSATEKDFTDAKNGITKDPRTGVEITQESARIIASAIREALSDLNLPSNANGNVMNVVEEGLKAKGLNGLKSKNTDTNDSNDLDDNDSNKNKKELNDFQKLKKEESRLEKLKDSEIKKGNLSKANDIQNQIAQNKMMQKMELDKTGFEIDDKGNVVKTQTTAQRMLHGKGDIKDQINKIGSLISKVADPEKTLGDFNNFDKMSEGLKEFSLKVNDIVEKRNIRASQAAVETAQLKIEKVKNNKKNKISAKDEQRILEEVVLEAASLDDDKTELSDIEAESAGTIFQRKIDELKKQNKSKNLKKTI